MWCWAAFSTVSFSVCAPSFLQHVEVSTCLRSHRLSFLFFLFVLLWYFLCDLLRNEKKKKTFLGNLQRVLATCLHTTVTFTGMHIRYIYYKISGKEDDWISPSIFLKYVFCFRVLQTINLKTFKCLHIYVCVFTEQLNLFCVIIAK